jgi:ABC-2 type transport system ATP-binding protein
MNTAIHITDLTRDFGTVRALAGLSMDVPAGVVFGFLGPNGSGKTTTIRLLLGLLEPTAGRAEVFGMDTRTQADAIRARCGALLENDGLYERLSAYGNLDFYGRINRMDPAGRASRIQALLTRLGLWDRRMEKIGGWSRGMRQKLAIARALLHRPPLVFLDEPTAGLDAVAAATLREDLAELVAEEGVTVFLTTHNLAEAEKLCAKVAVIRQGRLLAVGSPEALRTRADGLRIEIRGRKLDSADALLRARPEVQSIAYSNGQLVIALHEDAEVAPLVSLLVQAGAQVDEVRRETSSLEDVFFNLMEMES